MGLVFSSLNYIAWIVCLLLLSLAPLLYFS